MGADEYHWFGGRCTSAAETKYSIKKKETGYSSHFQGLSKKTIKASGNFHTKKIVTLSVLSIEDVNMRVSTEIITNFIIRGNEGILIGTTERPEWALWMGNTRNPKLWVNMLEQTEK